MPVDDEMDSNGGPSLANPRNETPIRILIIDDHRVIREALRMLIETQNDMQVVALAGTFAEGLAAVSREKPDVLLLDLDLGGSNVVEQIPELLHASRGMGILILTGVRDAQLHRRAVRLGAKGLVLKSQASDVVLKAIRKIHDGEAWINRSMMASLFEEVSGVGKERTIDHEAAKIGTLSRREREVITVLCEGLNNEQIAARLFISTATVRNHLTSILSKLELSDRFELAIYCYRHGLAQPPH